VSETAHNQTARLDLGLAERAGLWALALWLVATGGLLAVSASAAAGLALGGGLTLSSLALHLALARAWLRPPRRRWARGYLWAIWLVKWPAVGALLWFAVKSGWASPIWLCVGTGIVPLVATVMAVGRWPIRPSEGVA